MLFYNCFTRLLTCLSYQNHLLPCPIGLLAYLSYRITGLPVLQDYWLTWLHRQLVGTQVLLAELVNVGPTARVRVYAHCASKA